MGISAFCVFFANILLKEVLNPVEYGVYSIVVTYISLVSSFGLLGFEQVFLRITDNFSKNVLKTNKSLFYVILLVWVLFAFVCTFSLKKYFLEERINISLLYFFTLGVSVSMLLFNVFRINSNFFIAQLVGNYWKIILFIICCFFFFNRVDDVNFLIEILCFTFIVFSIISFFLVKKKIKIQLDKPYSIKDILYFGSQFFISLLTLSLISQGDKLFVEKLFGLDELGKYFYISNLFIFPFSLLQSYVGFKELVTFKKKFSKNVLFQKIKSINLYGLGLAIILFVFVFLINESGLISVNIFDNLELIIAFLSVGLIKLNYSLISSVFGAVGEIKSIIRANAQSLIISLLLLLLCYNKIESLFHVALVILALWIIRVVVWSYNVYKQ